MLLEIETLTILQGLTLGLGGFIVGCLAGLSGIGGGLLLVPMMVGLGLTPIQAIGTSNFTKLLICASGSWHSWRTGSLDLQKVAILGFPALICAQLGTYLASRLTTSLLWSAFAGLILLNIALIWWRQKVEKLEPTGECPRSLTFERSLAGGAAGLLAGLFGVGGGIILVPLQILLLRETVEIAVQTSLGVVFFSSMSACIAHSFNGNVMFLEGSLLGIAGAFGAQVGTRLLRKISQPAELFRHK